MKRVFFPSKITYENNTIISPKMRDAAHEIFLPTCDAGFRPGSRGFANSILNGATISWRASFFFSVFRGFAPVRRGPFLSAKGPKTIDAPFSHIT